MAASPTKDSLLPGFIIIIIIIIISAAVEQPILFECYRQTPGGGKRV
jgi:hypothetical protein